MIVIMAGSVYERELKEILSGNIKVITKIIATMPEIEKAGYLLALKNPFLTLRAAGSFGVDLIVIRDDFSFPIEVKSSKSSVIRFVDARGRAQKQAKSLIELTERAGVFPVYAYRLKYSKGDPWRIFAMIINNPEETLEGAIRLLYNILPKVHTSSHGNYILKWHEGYPLYKFLSYLNRNKKNNSLTALEE